MSWGHVSNERKYIITVTCNVLIPVSVVPRKVCKVSVSVPVSGGERWKRTSYGSIGVCFKKETQTWLVLFKHLRTVLL